MGQMDDLLGDDIDDDDADSPIRRRPKARVSSSLSREYSEAEDRAVRRCRSLLLRVMHMALSNSQCRFLVQLFMRCREFDDV